MKFILLLASSLLVAEVSATERFKTDLGISVGYAYNDSPLESWVDQGQGKLLSQNSNTNLAGFAEVKFLVTDTAVLHLVGELNSNRLGPAAGLTEAFLQIRPIPRGAVRSEFKVGTFYPSSSLENTHSGWRSEFTQTNSSISTWIAEEIRVTGAEWTGSIRSDLWGGDHRFKMRMAGFFGNDSAGALLAWRGWSLHNRQSGIRDRLTLPDLPVMQPGAPFEDQAANSDPFIESDGRPGFYAGGEWQWAGRFTANMLWYDNKADPETLEDGHYGWATRFFMAGIETELAGTRIIAQWMDGTTEMGPLFGITRAVENNFRSYSLLGARDWNKHRLAVRYDDFLVDDIDSLIIDPNSEDGRAFTASYRYAVTPRTRVLLEWVQIRSDREALADPFTERQLHFGVRYTFTD